MRLKNARRTATFTNNNDEDVPYLTDVYKEIGERMVDGQKFDEGKPEVGLISTRAIIEEAKVMTFGKKKYGDHNWRKGIAWSRCINALFRHALAYNNGEDLDPETGLSHLAHIRCCAAFLLEFEQTRKDLDDRFRSK